MPSDSPHIFISYSHVDEVWKDRLVKQLSVLQIVLSQWSDRKIAAGDDWEQEIHSAMNRADIAILLISADFLTSQYICKVEVPRLLERHKNDGLRIVPIIVSHCPWDKVKWLKPLQCRPLDGKPLAEFEGYAVDQQLAKIAGEIADLTAEEEEYVVVEPPVVSTDSKNANISAEDAPADIRELLERLAAAGGSNVAKAPADVEEAIQRGFADVDRTLMGLESQGSRITLREVVQVTGVAISHGAGIYNHSHHGRIGCARIYHRAALGLLQLAHREPARPGNRPQTGSGLAIEWLGRIVDASPIVRNDTADDLAWELRFTFDASRCVPQFDQLQDVLVNTGRLPNSNAIIASILNKALSHSRTVGEAHVSPFFLRHTAEVVVWIVHEHFAASRSLNSLADELSATVTAGCRIHRDNAGPLDEQLRNLLERAQQILNEGPNESGKGWFGSWFSRN